MTVFHHIHNIMKPSQAPVIELTHADSTSNLSLPYADHGIQAGFPSPAQDYITEAIDLNLEVVRHPAATFYGRVNGDSMIDEGIEDGDLIVIDRAIEPGNGDLAVCCVEGEFTLKRLKIEPDRIWLIPANETFDPIMITDDSRFEIWGVVTYVIKRKYHHR